MRVTKPNPKQTDPWPLTYCVFSHSLFEIRAELSAFPRLRATGVNAAVLQMRGHLLDFCPREERRRVQPVVESVANVAVDDEPHREVDEGEHAEGGEDDLHGGR